MRMLHIFAEEPPATALADALYVDGVGASVRETRDGGFALWVHEEDEMERAQALLARFLASPDDPIFTERQRAARAQRKAEEAREKQIQKRVERVRTQLERADGPPLMTYAMIAIAVGFYLLAEVRPEIARELVPRGSGRTMTEAVLNGLTSRPWTFLTPVFVHGGLLHLIFNVLWVRQLGMLVERAHSPWRLLLMTAVFGISGVVLELFWSGSLAVGLSGVVYGLLGYLYFRGKFDPRFPFVIPRTTMLWMMAWFALCFFPGFPVANGAHTAGLVLGSAWGYLASGDLGRRAKR